MFDLLLRHARLVDDTLTNIALQDGKSRRWVTLMVRR
ncbi:dihydroorotase [Salmonella enterica subsp. enterica]|nr:dihydroorotase [Salmonella enterica subsp. enterica]